MSKPLFLIPFRDGKSEENYSLYNTTFSYDFSNLSWSILTMYGTDTEIQNKLENIQDYFEQRHYKKKVSGTFQGTNITNKSRFEKITPSTQSIFLGLFIAAMEHIQNRVFCFSNDETPWASITITGDINYNSGDITLIDVDDIEEKFKAVELNAIKNEKMHLFIYISEKELTTENKNKNLIIKHFTHENSIFDIIDNIFQPYVPEDMPKDLDETQQNLFNSINGEIPSFYISTKTFEEYLLATEYRYWRGFFIHGEGLSGKSALAERIAAYLTIRGKIYAPVWIKIDNKKPQTDIAQCENFIISQICIQLKIDNDKINLIHVLSAKRYLLVFDNFECNETELLKYILGINAVIELIPGKKPYIIITSRSVSDSLLEQSELTPAAPPELQEESIRVFVEHHIKQNNLNIDIKADSAAFNNFISEIYLKLRYSPGLIIALIKSLRKRTIQDTLNTLKTYKDSGLRANVSKLFKNSFEFLDEKTQAVLFMILNCSNPDEPESREILFHDRLKYHWCINEGHLNDEDIQNSLDTLFDYNFIYITKDAKEIKYAIKSPYFLAFTFDEEFAGKDGIYSRDNIMRNLSWKLTIALRYDQMCKFVEPILIEMKKSKLKLSLYTIFRAVEYSSSNETLHLLKKYYPDFYKMQDDDGETVFMRAAADNPKKEIIEWFFENLNSNDINKYDKYSLNAFLHAVIFNSNPEIITLFANKNFNLDAPVNFANSIGYTPFLLALETNPNPEIIDTFINNYMEKTKKMGIKNDADAYINEKYYFNISKMQNPFENNKDDDEDIDASILSNFSKFIISNRNLLKNELKQNAVMPVGKSLINSNIEVFKKILKYDIKLKDINEYTGASLLSTAAKFKSNPEYLELVKSKDANFNINDCGKYNMTALHHAAYFNGSVPVFDWLYNNGINMDIIANFENGEKATAFEIACIYNQYPAVVKWFIDHDADIYTKNEQGLTPFECATKNSNPEILKVFLDAGVNINNTDEEKINLLHFAVMMNSNLNIMEMLIKEGIDINAQDINGDTPLHCAVYYEKNKNKINLLLKHGADPDIKNEKGKKALPWYKRIF